MTDDARAPAPETARRRDTGGLLLAAGGLAAAFGAASCCALPLLLGSLGLGSAWLVAIAWIAAPHRIALLTVAVACLAAGAGLLLWRRRAAASTPGAACALSPTTTVVGAGVLSLTAVLVVLGIVFA